jgi:hypothetical protein
MAGVDACHTLLCIDYVASRLKPKYLGMNFEVTTRIYGIVQYARYAMTHIDTAS